MKKLYWIGVFPLSIFVVVMSTPVIETALGKGAMIIWGPILWFVAQIAKWLLVERENCRTHFAFLAVQAMLITSSMVSVGISLLQALTPLRITFFALFFVWTIIATLKTAKFLSPIASNHA